MLPLARLFPRSPDHWNRRRRGDAGSRAVTVTGEALTQAAPIVQPAAYARKARLSEVTLGYAMLAPALILLLAFELFPILYGLFISTCDWRLSCVEFIGADNYVRAFRDPAMWHALLVTTTYSLIAVVLQLSVALFLAYLLYQKIAGQEAFR